MRNRLAHYAVVSLCYITHASQGRIGHGNETTEQGFVPQWNLTISESACTHTPLPSPETLSMWISVLFDFCPVFQLCTPDTTSHLFEKEHHFNLFDGIILSNRLFPKGFPYKSLCIISESLGLEARKLSIALPVQMWVYVTGVGLNHKPYIEKS